MTTSDQNQLNGAIARLYAGSLEGFIKKRDFLAKELRLAGKREAAEEVKGLRKPSRAAWALNVAARETRNVRRLDASVAATLEAQTAGGDVRKAQASLREAVREFADHASAAAQQAGHDLETGMLVSAVLALVGRTESLDALRRGRLVDVPEGGGLDFLAALPDSLPVRARPPSTTNATSVALENGRTRLELARETLREAESKLRLAESRLRGAEAEVAAARREYERARLGAETAAERIARLES